MQLTSKQVASKLGVSRTTVATLVRTGQLPSANKSENGKRVAYLFESKAVAEFKKTYAPTPRSARAYSSWKTRRRLNSNGLPNTGAGVGVLTALSKRLDMIDARLEQLLRLWM